MKKFSNKELLKIWSYVAANSFGGPAGQIAVIHKLVVEDKKIISEEKFLHALNFCMLLPGPEAQQLATYMGWLMAKWRGGFIAGALFILPGFLSILTLSYLYVLYNDITFVQGIFYGIKPAIIAIVIAALIRISKKALKNYFYYFISILSFIFLYFFNFPFPLIVLISGFIGIVYGKINKSQNSIINSIELPNLLTTIKTFSVWLCLWLTPIIIIYFLYGNNSTFHILNIFFSKMSLVTFGGAYAALSYVAQEAVNIQGWLTGTEMLDGLALAETTPGPLIQVVQYVGFMGAFRFPQNFNPLFSAFLGSVLTTWMTFAPCFLFIFTFAPYVEFIKSKKIFTDALSMITAAIVGVISNLSIWFVVNSLFNQTSHFNYSIFNFSYPKLNSIDIYATLICIIAFLLQFKFKKNLFTILGISIFLGILVKYF